MVDLIIPVYNNREGLVRSLMSIGTENIDLYVTIVDDCSNVSYQDIIEMFQHIFPIQYIRLEKNSGPGVAREEGLKHTKEPYLTFLDCGDTYTSPSFIQHQIRTAQENPTCVFFSWAHNECFMNGDFQYVDAGHNRLHGKLYKRSFIDRYNIHFNINCPRINEDIAFNFTARTIARYLEEINKEPYIYENPEAAVNWTFIGPSLVRANNFEYYYHHQNYGYAVNTEFALKLIEEAHVPKEFLAEDIAGGMAFLYMGYLSTMGRRPEFERDALYGAAYYYKHIFIHWADDNLKLVKDMFYNTLADYLSNRNDPIRDRLQIIDYAGFLNLCSEISETVDLDSFSLDCLPCDYVAESEQCQCSITPQQVTEPPSMVEPIPQEAPQEETVVTTMTDEAYLAQLREQQRKLHKRKKLC